MKDKKPYQWHNTKQIVQAHYKLIWVEGQPMLVPGTCDIATEHPDASLEGPWVKHWEQEERSKKEEEEEKKEEGEEGGG